MAYLLWYGISAIVLGSLLFFPLRKFMMAINVNRQQRKLKRAITDEERAILKRKTDMIAAFIAITFAFLYTRFLAFQIPQWLSR